MKRLAILGASGHGKVIADAALLSGWQEVVFYDDAWPELTNNSHWPVAGNTQALLTNQADFDGVIVAIGNNKIRLEKSIQLEQAGFCLVNVIHPTALISPFATIGNGCFISARSIIHVDAVIGDHVIINTAAIIEHDCVIATGSHISPNVSLAGGVKVGHCSWVGINATVRQLISIGDYAVVGAGGVVVNDVPAGAAVVGNPAKLLVKN